MHDAREVHRRDARCELRDEMRSLGLGERRAAAREQVVQVAARRQLQHELHLDATAGSVVMICRGAAVRKQRRRRPSRTQHADERRASNRDTN